MAENFTVVISPDGKVVSVDGKSDWQRLADSKEPVTSIVVPLEVLKIGAMTCIHSGCRIICK